MDLKSFLKSLKLNENNISMVLGALVVVVVGVLVINYFREQKSATLLPGTKTENGSKALPAKHTVTKGENLWKIAEDYYKSGYNWVDIAKENKLRNPGVITTGQVLTIPNVEVKTPKATETKKAVTNLEPITGATYQVVKGDNLWKIAVRAYGDGYKWSEIARENKLVHPNLIHSGNILILPR